VPVHIISKYDGIGGETAPRSWNVFMKVLNELQGYYGYQGYIRSLRATPSTSRGGRSTVIVKENT